MPTETEKSSFDFTQEYRKLCEREPKLEASGVGVVFSMLGIGSNTIPICRDKMVGWLVEQGLAPTCYKRTNYPTNDNYYVVDMQVYFGSFYPRTLRLTAPTRAEALVKACNAVLDSREEK